MATHPSTFVWYELMTSDAAAARAFYAEAIGWRMKSDTSPGVDYTHLCVGERDIGGLMTIPPDAAAMGLRPAWFGYIGVADVDAAVAAIKADGGAVHRPPADIPNVGRFAVVADPQGAAFNLFSPAAGSGAPPSVAPGTPGHIGWHELYALDGKTAFAFYAKHFGWSAGEAMDMGPMGSYQMFSAGADPIGGMMTKPPEVPVACWGFYINVAAVDATVARIQAGGGKLLNGPMQVPGGSWIANCADPQGAAFSIVGTQR
ncbi:MAG: VOC family protein [Burkholderiales bacterium]|nr:VOC family protein [Burkholderiales bacterium]